MQYQGRPFTCGPTAVSNALCWLYGDSAPLFSDVENMFRNKDGWLDPEGYDSGPLKAAIRAFGAKAKGHSWPSLKKFWGAIKHVSRRGPLIMHDRSRGHWILVLGKLDHTKDYVVIDSAHEDMILRWPESVLVSHVHEKGCRIYGISVTRG